MLSGLGDPAVTKTGFPWASQVGGQTGSYTAMTEWWGWGRRESGGRGAEGREDFLEEGRSELKPSKKKAERKGKAQAAGVPDNQL